VSSVPADPDGKQQQVVETLNIGDLGTSVLLDAQVRTDFSAEVAKARPGRPLPALWVRRRASPWTATPVGSAVPRAVIFLPRWCASVAAWASRCTSVRLITRNQMLSSNALIAADLGRMPDPRAACHPGAGSSGDRGLGRALPFPATQPGAFLWQPAATHRLPAAAQLTSLASDR
jgi:hypothetical protein